VRDVVILGSTGSIGTQALEVVAEHLDQFRVVGLAAGGQQIEVLARQALETGAQTVAVSRATAVQDLQLALYAEASRRGWSKGEVKLPRILAGPDVTAELAAMPCDVRGSQQRLRRCTPAESLPSLTKSLWWSVVHW
jgi:1-deoxy-D-xylulose-5-phosphate reductoisomerase